MDGMEQRRPDLHSLPVRLGFAEHVRDRLAVELSH